jgi:hypothetical protein
VPPNFHAPIRLALLVVAGGLLLWLSWIGIGGGFAQLPQSRTPGETVQTMCQFGFGLFALLSVPTTFWARRWNPVMLGGWIVTASLAAGLAPVVWGGTSLLIGFVSGAGAFLIAVGIAWLLRAGARGVREA